MFENDKKFDTKGIDVYSIHIIGGAENYKKKDHKTEKYFLRYIKLDQLGAVKILKFPGARAVTSSIKRH